jgi:hypothetical protein
MNKKLNDLPLDQMTMYLIKELNRIGILGAFLGGVTSNNNYLIRFNNLNIPTILVAESYLNEPFLYKYNICKRQKNLTKEYLKDPGIWIHYYPFAFASELINEMMVYKIYLK